jgi:NADPH-dependent curcumin reductase CurA
MNARTNRQVRLVSRPRGIPQAEHFSLVTEPVASPGKGQILVRNRYHSAPTMVGIYHLRPTFPSSRQRRRT